MLVEAAVILRTSDLASALLPELEPFADHISVIGLGTASVGAAARLVALLEWMLDRYDDADRHFARAHELNVRFGARCYDVRSNYDHASMLLERDAPGDRRAAPPA